MAHTDGFRANPLDIVVSPAIASRLPEAAAMVELRRLELTSKRYQPGIIAASISRAVGSAAKTVEPLTEDIQGAAFLQYLAHNLQQTEDWCSRVEDKL